MCSPFFDAADQFVPLETAHLTGEVIFRSCVAGVIKWPESTRSWSNVCPEEGCSASVYERFLEQIAFEHSAAYQDPDKD